MGIKGRGCHPRHWYTYLSMFVLYETEKDERGTFHLKKNECNMLYSIFIWTKSSKFININIKRISCTSQQFLS